MATLQQGSADEIIMKQDRKGKKSFMLAFAIDQQNDSEADKSPLGDAIKKGSDYITQIFVDKKIVESRDVLQFQSSTNPAECSQQGIQENICKCTKSVGKDGLFVLYLSGHGESHGFIPGDYSARKRNSISAKSLGGCLSSTWGSIGNIIVILDCCFAGKLAKSLAKLAPRNVWILSACTGCEETLTFESLECSIFTYLVGRAIDNISCEDLSGSLQSASLTAIHNSCTASVKALTALSSDRSRHYESGMEQGWGVHVDGDVQVNVIEWLKGRSKHIAILINERAFEDERLCGQEKRVLKIALSLMMYSVAWLEMNSSKMIPDSDIYLVAFNEAVQVFRNLECKFEITYELRLQCLDFYWDVVEALLAQNKIKKDDIKKRYEEFRTSLKNLGYKTGESKVSVY